MSVTNFYHIRTTFKMYVKALGILIFILNILSCENKDNSNDSLSKYVNPFIGASTNIEKAGASHGLGKTFPGAVTPFGLVQLSPNTFTGGDNGSGYSNEHTTIEGFAFTQMSGIGWYGDLGNFLVMPTTGPLKTSSGRIDKPEEGYRSRYSKNTEKAYAGYYSVYLTDYNIMAETTAAPHSGIMRFTFPKNDSSRIQIDLARRVGGTSTSQYIEIVDDRTIKGWMRCPKEGGGWGNGEGNPNYTVFYYAQFNKPFKNTGVWKASIPDNWQRKRKEVTSPEYQQKISEAMVFKNFSNMEGKHLGFFTEFETEEHEQVLLKAGISFVSMDGAQNNLESEIAGWDFDKVYHSTNSLWNNALSKIVVEGGTDEEKTVFYTALYHTMIDPRKFADVDGKYIGGDGIIHQPNAFTKRTIFSGWDVFRSQFPLQTIINPKVVNDMINSLITLADETKNDYLERWEFLNAYSGCMIGNPAVSVITDAYIKGIRDYDIEKAYNYCKQTVEKYGNGQQGYADGISTTLEYAYSEWCMSELARALGKSEDIELYTKRSQSYRNIFDKTKQWFRPKNTNGTWAEWPKNGRLTQDYGTIESNLYQQGWFVPHDVDGMVELMGGSQKVINDLILFFEKAPEDMLWNNYYNHANEPVHHVPFLFNKLKAPWLTQKWTREICKRAYNNSVEGLIGNEDVGQMSAWYVLAATGIHPISPGDTRFEITSPVFSKITYNLNYKNDNGKKFIIEAKNNSYKNIYIQSAKLNGKPYDKSHIEYIDIVTGGELILEMGDSPNYKWGVSGNN